MNILRYEENGVEFFTLQATGESGMSQSGLARLCGVKPHAINQLLKTLITSSCPESLKYLQDMDLELITSVNKFNNATILKDIVCATILEWYAFESQRPNETARQAFRKFAAVGIRTWIQQITGWQNAIPPMASPSEPAPNLPIHDLDHHLEQLEHNIFIALKHRHAIHNIVEKPTAVDLSLNKIVHTAVHVQAGKLAEALRQVQALRQLPLALQSSEAVSATTIELRQLRRENQKLQRCLDQDRKRLKVLQQRRGTTPNLAQGNAQYEDVLQQRIEEITEQLMKGQKRKGGQRAIQTCQLRGTMLARYELGETLEEIALDLGRPYETVKTYVKLARQGLTQ